MFYYVWACGRSCVCINMCMHVSMCVCVILEVNLWKAENKLRRHFSSSPWYEIGSLVDCNCVKQATWSGFF